MMKLFLAAVLFLQAVFAPLRAVAATNAPTMSPTMTNGKPDPVTINPDKVAYSGTDGTASVVGANCAMTDQGLPASGTGKYGTDVIKYNCLETGYYNGEDYAIACGEQMPSKGTIACQAWRVGPKFKKSKLLATNIITCDTIVTKECNQTKTCPFNCTADVCQQFPKGIAWFEGANTGFGNLFTTKTTGKLTITPKRLTVNEAGHATKWRDLTMAGLCFEANSITNCYQAPQVKTQADFDQCLDFRYAKHESLGWLGPLDAAQLKGAADGANLYKTVKTKKPTKKKKG